MSSMKDIFSKSMDFGRSRYKEYSENIAAFLPSEDELEEQRKHPLRDGAFISVIAAAYETDREVLLSMNRISA